MKSFVEYFNENLKDKKPTIGIHIKDSSKEPFTDWIINGEKTIETRNKRTLSRFIGQRVGLIRTGRGRPAMLVGYATIGDPIVYTNKEDFDSDYSKHLVSPKSDFYIKNIKYGYPLLDVEKINPVGGFPFTGNRIHRNI